MGVCARNHFVHFFLTFFEPNACERHQTTMLATYYCREIQSRCEFILNNSTLCGSGVRVIVLGVFACSFVEASHATSPQISQYVIPLSMVFLKFIYLCWFQYKRLLNPYEELLFALENYSLEPTLPFIHPSYVFLIACDFITILSFTGFVQSGQFSNAYLITIIIAEYICSCYIMACSRWLRSKSVVNTLFSCTRVDVFVGFYFIQFTQFMASPFLIPYYIRTHHVVMDSSTVSKSLRRTSVQWAMARFMISVIVVIISATWWQLDYNNNDDEYTYGYREVQSTPYNQNTGKFGEMKVAVTGPLGSFWSAHSYSLVADGFIGLVVASALLLLLQVYFCYAFDSYDPEQQLLNIALSYSMNAEKITTLLHPSLCAITLLEAIIVAITVLQSTYWLLEAYLDTPQYDYSFYNGGSYAYNQTSNSYVLNSNVDIYNRSKWNHYITRDNVIGVLCTLIYVLHMMSHTILLAMRQWTASRSVAQTLICLFSFDVVFVTAVLRGMEVAVLPLSILSCISTWKSEHWSSIKSSPHNGPMQNRDNPCDGNLLSFQLRDNWVDGKPPIDCWDMLKSFVQNSSQRFTIVYSLCKLVMTVIFALYANPDYNKCNAHYFPQRTAAMECYLPDFCQAYCTHSGKINHPVFTDGSSGSCTVTVSGECLCYNWLSFQFSVLLLHVVHFAVQCYFFLRYSYFDPQQNQIDCVQSYSFAGENLMMFLSHPSICFLSAVEAIALLIVWFQLIMQPGTSCSGQFSSYSWYWAGFTTFVEVYKANMATSTQLLLRRDYAWALWSLLRVDLFVFYGFTLILQTFLFPFSLLGHSVTVVVRSVSHARLSRASASALNEALLVIPHTQPVQAIKF